MKRKIHFVAITAFLACGLLTNSSSTFAQGDNCTNAVAIMAGTHNADGPASGGGCFNCQLGSSVNADWYSFTAPSNGLIDINSCSDPGDTDTRLWVYDGTCAALNLIADNDDACNTSGYGSSVSGVSVSSGTTYYIEWTDRWSSSAFVWDLTFTPVSCTDPTGISVSSSTPNSIDIAWTSNNVGSDYFLSYGAPNSPILNRTNIQAPINSSSQTASITGLTANTAYDVYLQEICGIGDSTNSFGPFLVTTACLASTAPYSENFDTGVLPSCWTSSSSSDGWVFNNGLSPSWGLTVDHTTGASANGKVAWIDGSVGSGHVADNSLLSPFVDVSSLSAPIVEFWYHSSNTANSFYVTLTVNLWDGANWNNAVITNTGASTNSTWQQYVIDLTGYTITGPIQVEFIGDETSIAGNFQNDIAIDDFRIFENSPIANAVVDSNATCNGLANGGATAIATGGSSPYTYAWSNTATTESITGILAGTYSVTVTDNNGLTDSASVTVTEPISVVASTVVDNNASCNGSLDGGATASATGGTGAYTYGWSNAATTASITGVPAGTYGVTITDANGCTNSSSAIITEPTSLVASAAVDSSVSCNGSSDGGATASATGGTGAYTYGWSNAATTASITGLVAGIYNVTITDANGCINSSSATITEPTVFAASKSSTDVSCNGGSDGTITATTSGGTAPYTYQWFGNTGGQTTATVTNLTAGSYDVLITDANGCTTSFGDTITEPISLVASTVVNNNASCNGSSDGGATASATGGTGAYTYAWSNAATTASITGLVAGIYNVTITDANGCINSSSATITEPTVLAASKSSTDVSCNGGSDGTITATTSGGTAPYTFQWFGNTAGQTTATVTNLTAGSYDVLITDANGCTTSFGDTITEPISLVASTVVNNNASCNGSSDGGATASATGGTGAYTYAWSNAATTASITGVLAGTYNVTITDANGCVNSSSATITEPTSLVASTVVDSNASCNGLSDGGATASATGGTGAYTYGWSNAATTASITGVPAGSYAVTITDANGCTNNSSATITEPTSVVASTVVDSNASCNGSSDGGATASATGGTGVYTYAWSNAATTASITGVPAGTYGVTITDANGCVNSSSATITEPTSVVASAVVDSNASCNGSSDGGATASATGGTGAYTYGWSNAATTASITGVPAGSYAVTITDANGCVNSSSATITEPTSVVASAVVDSNASCNGSSDGGATASATGGTGAYTYGWSNAATTASITGVPAGSYGVTITDANGCVNSSSATITEPTSVVASAVVDSNASCNGSSDGGATASATGGTGAYTYGWSNAATTASITGVPAGSYAVTITDANGCTNSSSVTITEPAIVNTTVSQSGFVLTANQLGATYQWLDCNNGNIPIVGATSQSYTVTSNGNYAVEVTLNGCADTSVCINILNVGIEAVELKQTIQIYPNPTRSSFTIELPAASNYELLQILDLRGSIIKEVQLQSVKETIDVSGFVDGIYIVKYGNTFKKLVVTE